VAARVSGRSLVIRLTLAASQPLMACTAVDVIRPRLVSTSSEDWTFLARSANSTMRECTASCGDESYAVMVTSCPEWGNVGPVTDG
jgi:hypothetical protein